MFIIHKLQLHLHDLLRMKVLVKSASLNKYYIHHMTLIFFLALLCASFSLFQYASEPITRGSLITGRRFLISYYTSLQAPQMRTRVPSDEKEVIIDSALYCDRSHHRTDVCLAKGDVRVVGGGNSTNGGSASTASVYEVVVFTEGGAEHTREEMIRPYTRKWEESVMRTIDQVKVKVIRKAVMSYNSTTSDGFPVGYKHFSSNYTIQQNNQNISELQQAWKHVLQASSDQELQQMAKLHEQERTRRPLCDVHYKIPAILFSTGGYTGNVYHEFNDGLIPLYITAKKYPKAQVVILLLEYHDWWMTKYAEVIAQITSYPVIDLANDKRVHCFPEVTVGLHIHEELAIHDDLLVHNEGNHDIHIPGPSMTGFQAMLRSAYLSRLQNKMNKTDQMLQASIPKLVVISRPSPRALLNEQDIISLAKEIGFAVEVLSPKPSTEMVDIYSALSTCDVMLGVHGAAMTHLLFMRPGATFIQVVPLGMDWAAATYYGEPAEKLGLIYRPYRVHPKESSLSEKYASNDPVLLDPDSINNKGWWETKRIYLEGQDVRLSLPRMREVLGAAYTHHLHTVSLDS